MEEHHLCRKCMSGLRSQSSTLIVLVSIIVGVIMGVAMRYTGEWDEEQLVWVSLPGQLFMRLLQCLSIPIVMSKLVSSVGSMEMATGGKSIVLVVIFYACLNIIIEITGVCVFKLIQPAGIIMPTLTNSSQLSAALPPSLAIKDLAFNMIPDNLATAFFSRYQTRVESNGSSVWYISEQTETPNIVGLVVICTSVAVGIAKLGDVAAPLLALSEALSSLTSLLMSLVITWVCPVGLVSLVASQVVAVDNPQDAISQLGMFVLTVISGELLLPLVILPCIFIVMTRSNPFTFFGHMSEAVLVNFGTASSISTFPVTLRCLVNKNGVEEKVAGLALSLGTLINLSSYPMISILFIAQLEGRPLDVEQIAITMVILTLMVFGTSGIPQDSFLTVLLLCGMHGLPTQHMTSLLAVDWLLDRVDSVCKTLTDATAVGVVAHLTGGYGERGVEDNPVVIVN